MHPHILKSGVNGCNYLIFFLQTLKNYWKMRPTISISICDFYTTMLHQITFVKCANSCQKLSWMLISHGYEALASWPASSPNFSPLNFLFMLGYLEITMPMVNTIEELWHQIQQLQVKCKIQPKSTNTCKFLSHAELNCIFMKHEGHLKQCF